MFKKKWSLSEVSDHCSKHLLLSASLLLSLSAGTAYSVIPPKGTGSDTANVMLPPRVELNANMENLNLQPEPGVTVPLPPETDGDEAVDGDEGANGDAAVTDEFIRQANTHWQERRNALMTELLGEDQTDGTTDVFPVRVPDSLTDLRVNEALNAIHTSPHSYTLIDLHYALWQVAQQLGDPVLLRALSANARMLDRYLSQGRITFNQQLGEQLIEGETLLNSVRTLQHHINHPEADSDVVARFTDVVFVALYNYINVIALNAFRVQLNAENNDPQAGHILTFLQNLAQISSMRFDGVRHVQSNNLAYARSRAWYFLLHQSTSTESERSPQENRNLYASYVSLTALFTAFLGQTNQAYNMLSELERVEPAFWPRYDARSINCIVSWVVDGNLRMFNSPDSHWLRNRIVQALFFMMKYPFSPHTPHNIILEGQLQVFTEVQRLLGPVVNAEPELFSFNPGLLPQITTKEAFEKDVIETLKQQQQRSRAAQDKQSEESKKHKKSGGWKFWKPKEDEQG
ncbi:hypothetical protein [Endozoicomonas lisbonensis]|uniref:hypothetical protein n=1 Tax=Endozoicomonas lisbonensis TaxID=3120522 RepID=UPI00339439E1